LSDMAVCDQVQIEVEALMLDWRPSLQAL
jgi:hypothetical protein